jgi:hypothetical protein
MAQWNGFEFNYFYLDRINRRCAGQVGTKVWLRMPHKVRTVNRFVPESCPMWGNPPGEALTGVGIGQVLSFERSQIRVPTVFLYTEGNTSSDANDKELGGPAESETLRMYQYTLCWKPGGPNGI